MSASKKFPIPLSYFSIALGLFALGLSWRYGASVGLLPALAAESLLAAASVVWLLLVAAYLIKMFAYRNDFLSDLRDLVQCCFISAIPITAMLEGLALKPYQAG
ncbi:potassium-tellurite ethidium and proflavin transporter, partial [Neisseria meningitidis]